MAAQIADIETGAGVPSDGSPDLDDVLYSLRQPPYTYSDMREFLESEYNSENIDFWGTVEEYRQRFEKTKAPKIVRVSEAGSMASKEGAAKLILDTYIAEGSEKEVNISGTQRAAVVSALGPQGESGSSSDAVFAEAQNEIKRIMQTDSYPRFLKTVTTTNLSPASATWRTKVGISLVLFGALVVSGLFIGLELAGIVGTPLFRLASLPILIVGFGFLISGRQKV